MKRKRLCNILLALMLSVAAWAADSIAADQPKKEKKQIYYSTQVKLDILSPVLTPALNNWQMQQYELATNVQLARRFFPTIELGYAGGKTHNDSVQYNGHGGFVRIGCDINPLKKHPESPHAMLVGVRIGSAVQTKGETDCWGEIVAGCQVEIAQVNKTAFYMGWMARFKCLFTRTQARIEQPNIEINDATVTYLTPIYIPGFGSRDDISWGISYHLGWRF